MDSFNDAFRKDAPISELSRAFQMLRDKPLKPRTAMIPTDFCNTCFSAWRISDKLENCPDDGTPLRRRLVEILV